MSTATGLVSIGDHAVMSVPLPQALSEIWIDRDLSWLDFNAKVLAEAVDGWTPLLERVKFLAIFTSNLDEFFMKRMAVLRYLRTGERNPLVRQIREKLTSMLRSRRIVTGRPWFRNWQSTGFSCGTGWN